MDIPYLIHHRNMSEMKSQEEKIQVMLIDDSAVVRHSLTEVLNRNSDIEVIAACQNPYIAAQKLRKQTPDVIVLDIEMPRMDGITFLKKIMSQRPIPVIICSTLATKGSDTTLRALEYGAIDIIQKPSIGTMQFLHESRILIADSVRAAAGARIRKISARYDYIEPKLSADVMLDSASGKTMTATTDKVVVIGASTGGTEAVRKILEVMPRDSPGIVVVQHMPKGFTASFAGRLNDLCNINVKEASDGDSVLCGHALIAPGNSHILLKRSGSRYFVEVRDGPLVSRHRPSVDVLFRSAARYAGSNAIAAILTGMGDDGATGMKELHDAGAHTIAQDEQTSVVYGMPAVAARLGGVDSIMPLNEIAAAIINGTGIKTSAGNTAG